MKKTKTEYESAIDSAKIFGMDCAQNPNMYAAEERKFITLVAEYLYAISNEFYSDYGLEIIEVTQDCLKSYNVERGKFTHYFNRSLRLRILRAKGEETVFATRNGLSGGSTKELLLKKIFKLLSHNNQLSEEYVMGKELSEETIQMLSIKLDVPIEKIKDALFFNAQGKVRGEYISNAEDEEISIFDMKTSDVSLETDYINREELVILCAKIDRIFRIEQARIKPKLKDILTAEILKASAVAVIGYKGLITLKFININALLAYKNEGIILSSRQIAEKHGVLEQDIARTRKKFFAKIKASFANSGN